MRILNPRTIRRLPAALAVLTLAGCATQPPFQDLPAGGVDANTGQLVIDDVWVGAPQGLAAGSQAPLHLTVTNESSGTADALVGAWTPVATHVVLLRDGQPVRSIAVPAGTQTDLEWRTSIELEGVRRDLRAGQWFPVTLRFARSAPVTALVAAGPLAAPSPSHPPSHSTSRPITRQPDWSVR